MNFDELKKDEFGPVMTDFQLMYIDTELINPGVIFTDKTAQERRSLQTQEAMMLLFCEVKRLRGAILRSLKMHPNDCLAENEYNARCDCKSVAELAEVVKGRP